MKGLKGIESVIAVVILIAISIALAGVLFAWYRGTLQIEQGRTETAAECGFLSFEITDVFLSQGSGRFVIENTGQKPLALSFALLETANAVNSFPLNTAISGRSFASLPFSFNGTCADFRSLTVHTACAGVSARFSEEPECD